MVKQQTIHEQLEAFYEARIQKALDTDGHEIKFLCLLKERAPYLCRQLALGKSLSHIEVEEEAFTGFKDVRLQTYPLHSDFNPRFFTSHLPEEMAASLGIEHMENQSPTPSRLEMLREGLAIGSQHFPMRFETIKEQVSLMLWQRSKSLMSDQAKVFTAISFPTFPHAVIMTDLGGRQLQPRSVLNKTNPYAVFENLYFASFLLELYAKQTVEGSLFDDAYLAENTIEIKVSGKDCVYPFRRAFFELLAWSELLTLRLEAQERKLKLVPGPTLTRSIEALEQAIQALLREIMPHSKALSKSGVHLLGGLATQVFNLT